MAKKQTDRLRVEKVRGQGPKEIFGENAQIHDKSVNSFSKTVLLYAITIINGKKVTFHGSYHGQSGVQNSFQFCKNVKKR